MSRRLEEEPWKLRRNHGSDRFDFFYLFTTARVSVLGTPVFTQITIKRNDGSTLVETAGLSDKS